MATHNTEKIFTVEDKIIDPYEDTKIKVCGIILHLVIGLFGSIFWFGIIHFERFGGDPQKRSISNKILSYIATSTLIFKIICGEIITIVRILFGCLPSIVGGMLIFCRQLNIYFITPMFMFNMIYKCTQLYFPSFTLGLNDDFWSFIFLITISAFTTLHATSKFVLGYHHNLSYRFFTCSILEVEEDKM